MDRWEIIAAVFMVLAVCLSFYEILGHMFNFNKPYLQRYIIRILLIVPIYSLNAWIAMILPGAGLYLDSLREVYESFVIYSFMRYLLNFLNYETNLQQYIDDKPAPHHLFPLCCLPICTGGKSFMLSCKHGILQYVVIRPITTMIAFISQIFGFYGEQNYIPTSGYTYPVLLIINNFSQATAMYSLIIFYTGYRQELQPMQPLAKFLSIKLVVFFSFFQSVLIAGLLEIEFVEQSLRGWFPELDDKIMISRKLQEFLICFDMLVASVGHLFAFSYKPFAEQGDDTTAIREMDNFSDRSCCRALCNIFDFNDEKSDVSEHLGRIGNSVKRLFTRQPALPSVVSTSGPTFSYDNQAIVQTDIEVKVNKPQINSHENKHSKLEKTNLDSFNIQDYSAKKRNYQSFD